MMKSRNQMRCAMAWVGSTWSCFVFRCFLFVFGFVFTFFAGFLSNDMQQYPLRMLLFFVYCVNNIQHCQCLPFNICRTNWCRAWQPLPRTSSKRQQTYSSPLQRVQHGRNWHPTSKVKTSDHFPHLPGTIFMLRSSAFVCFYVCATFISFARATRKSANGKGQTLKDKEEALSFLIGIGLTKHLFSSSFFYGHHYPPFQWPSIKAYCLRVVYVSCATVDSSLLF